MLLSHLKAIKACLRPWRHAQQTGTYAGTCKIVPQSAPLLNVNTHVQHDTGMLILTHDFEHISARKPATELGHRLSCFKHLSS